MSWICPNCSSTNDETQTKCFVCGMDRPSVEAEPVSEEGPEEGKIVFSDFEAFTESVKNLFRARPFAKRAARPVADGPSREQAPKQPKDKKPKKVRSSKGDFARPWPEHHIEFDVSAIKEGGYVRSEQQTLSGVNGYRFYTADGSSRFLRVEMLLLLKMAHKV